MFERKYFELNENVYNISKFVGYRLEGGIKSEDDRGGNVPPDQVFKGH